MDIILDIDSHEHWIFPPGERLLFHARPIGVISPKNNSPGFIN